MIKVVSCPNAATRWFEGLLQDVYHLKSVQSDPAGQHDRARIHHPSMLVHTNEDLRHLQGNHSTNETVVLLLVQDVRSILFHRARSAYPDADRQVREAQLVRNLTNNEDVSGMDWSGEILHWLGDADLAIKLEDAIVSPLAQLETIAKRLGWRPPSREAVVAYLHATQTPNRLAYLTEWNFSPVFERLVTAVHRPALTQLNYAPAAAPKAPKKILVEGSKLLTSDNDGIKRYVAGLRNGLQALAPHFPHLEILHYFGNGTLIEEKSIAATKAFAEQGTRERIVSEPRTMGYEKFLLLCKERLRKVIPKAIYSPLAKHYREGPYQDLLRVTKITTKKLLLRHGYRTLKTLIQSADLVHLPLPQNFREHPSFHTPVLVTAHDFSHRRYPEHHTPENVRFTEEGMQAALRQDAAFLSVSTATDQSLAEEYHVPRNKRFVALEAADEQFSFYSPPGPAGIKRIRAKYGIPEQPYLFCLSTIEPRKNLRRMITAFIQSKAERPTRQANLVIGGKHGWKTKDIFTGLELNRPDIIFTGFIADEDLPTLYAQARALCFCSLYEGFGLPIVEAMACSTPVIYGNNSAQIEVAGTGGIGVDAQSVEAISVAMAAILDDNRLHEKLSKAASQESLRFSWEMTALHTIAAYEALLYPDV